ncbi:MAG: glycosyltransferase family 39 protein [Sideroxydans sp.]
MLFGLVWFGALDYRKLVLTDEGRYAEIPREMVVSGDWVTPRLNDLKYFEKPPLQYWATAVTYLLFGEHHWTARLWTALTGFLGILVVGYTGRRLFGREAGLYAALICASAALYGLMGNVNTLDMGVTFFMTLGICALLIAQQEDRPRWMLLAWAALALAVLSKGLMGLVLPGAALFLYALFNRDFKVWLRLQWRAGLGVFLLLTVPWFLLVMRANPEFFDFFFIHEHFERFTSKVHGRYQPWHYFIPILLLGMLPWTLLMFDALRTSWRRGRSGGFSAARFLLVWVGFIYVFFSLSDSKLPSYLLPMVPALALLMGAHLAQIAPRRLFWLLTPMPLLLLALLAFVPTLPGRQEAAIEQQLYAHYVPWLLVAGAVWLAATLSALHLLWRARRTGGVLVLAIGSLLALQIALAGYDELAPTRSAYRVAQAIRPYVKPQTAFYSIRMYEQALPFYLKRTQVLVQYDGEMAFGIQQEPQRALSSLAAFAATWQTQADALAIMPLAAWDEVRGLNLPLQEIYRDELYVVVRKP